MQAVKYLSIILGIGLLVWIVSGIDLSAVGELIIKVGPAGLAAVIFVYFLAFLGDTISWLLILTSLPVSYTWIRRTFFVRLAGEAFNNVVPAGGFAGEPVKALLLKARYGVGYTEASASIVMARTINMVALIVFLFVGFVFMASSEKIGSPLKLTASIGLGFLAFGTLLIFAIQRFRISSWVMSRFAGMRWAGKAAGMIAVIEDMDHRFVAFYTRHRAKLLAALSLALINWILGVVEIYLTYLFLGHEITWRDAWMMEALTQMVRSAVFFIPLGIGAQEGAFVLISNAITGVPSLGLACAAVRRIREVSWIIFGLLVWLLYPTDLKAEQR